MIPTSREEFKEFCLRALGHPVITVDVSDEQVEDRIDEALQLYQRYHHDGSQRVYFKYQVTEQDAATKTIFVPENIIGVLRILPVTGAYDIFNIQLAAFMNELNTLASANTVVPFYMARERINLLNEILVGIKPLRFNRHKNQIHLDVSNHFFRPGMWLVFEAFSVIDPEVYPDVWSDPWLQQYTIQKIKYQWGTNLSKFSGIVLPGGQTLNGEQLKSEAAEKIAELENDVINNYSQMPLFFVG